MEAAPATPDFGGQAQETSTGTENTAPETNTEPTSSSEPRAQSTKDKPVSKKWKLRVNDKDHEVDENELVKRAQLGWAADEKFKSASKIQKEYEPLLKNLKSGDKKQQIQTLKDLMGNNDSLLDIAQDLLLEQIEYNSLSESEKEALELKRENASLKEFKEKQEADRQEAEQQRALYRAQQEINGEISDVLKTLGSKPTPRLVKRVAEEMLAHLDSKGGRMKAADAMQRAVSGIETDIAEYLGNLPADKLRQVLPKKVIESLRKANIEDVTTMRGNRVGKKPLQSRSNSRDRVTTDDYFSKLEKKFGR